MVPWHSLHKLNYSEQHQSTKSLSLKHIGLYWHCLLHLICHHDFFLLLIKQRDRTNKITWGKPCLFCVNNLVVFLICTPKIQGLPIVIFRPLWFFLIFTSKMHGLPLVIFHIFTPKQQGLLTPWNFSHF